MNHEPRTTDNPDTFIFDEINLKYILNMDLAALQGYSNEVLMKLRDDVARVYRSTDNQSRRDIISHVLSNIDSILANRKKIGARATGDTIY